MQWRSLALWFLLLSCVASCKPVEPAGSRAGSRALIYVRGGESELLDPIHTDIGESVKVMVNIFDTLIAYGDETTDLVPGLAEKWEMSEDGLSWTFHLRPNVRFHDGTPCDAEAVKFSLERLTQGTKNPYTFSEIIPYSPAYQQIKQIRVVDEVTLVFELSEPSAVFENNMAMFSASIVSPKAVKELGEEFGRKPVGSGPFKFVSWIRDQELIIEANRDYWAGPPGVDRVVFVPVKESAVRIEQLLRGEAQMADDLPPSEVETLRDDPALAVQSKSGINVGYLSMQMEKPPLDNVKLRHAIWHAIDKQGLIEVAWSGQAEPAVNMLPPSLFGWHDGIEDRRFDLDLAKELLSQAKAEAGFETPLPLDLFIMGSPRPYMQQPQETAVFIKESLKKIGIEIRIVTSEVSEHFRRLSAGEHQLALAGWSSDNCDPDNFLYQLLDPDNINDSGGNNVSRYNNPEVHRLLLGGQRELDKARRLALYRSAQEQIFADAPVVPLVHSNINVVHRSDVEGYVLHPTSLVRLRHARIKGPPR